MKSKFNVISVESSETYKIKNILKLIESLENHSVSAGFFSDSVYPDGTPIASVAMWNNDGTETIPERPFFTKGMLIGRMSANALSSDMLSDVVMGHMSLFAYLTAIGNTYQDSIVDAIDSDVPPPNSPETWERKMRKGLNISGKKAFRKMKAEGKEYLDILKSLDAKYESGKNIGKNKYKIGSGSSKTLIDQGLMRKAVSYKVDMG